jgi:hypothetical protein
MYEIKMGKSNVSASCCGVNGCVKVCDAVAAIAAVAATGATAAAAGMILMPLLLLALLPPPLLLLLPTLFPAVRRG